MFHEFGHSFVNPIVYANENKLMQYDSLFKYMEGIMNLFGYSDWLTVYNEHLVRAGESILLKLAGFPEESSLNTDENYYPNIKK